MQMARNNNKTGGHTIRSSDLTKTIYIYGHIIYDKENNPVQRKTHILINRAGATEYHIKNNNNKNFSPVPNITHKNQMDYRSKRER